jgi:hypothetical protein
VTRRAKLVCAALALLSGWAAPAAAQQYSSSRTETSAFLTPEVSFTTFDHLRATLVGVSAGTVQGGQLLFGVGVHHLPFNSRRDLTYGGVIAGWVVGSDDKPVWVVGKTLVGYGRVAETNDHPLLDYSEGVSGIIAEPKIEFWVRNPRKDRFRLVVSLGYRLYARANPFEPSAAGPTVSTGLQVYFR